MADQEIFIIAPDDDPSETVKWLEWRGYRGVVTASAVPGLMAVVLFSRKNEPVMMAQVGDVLVCQSGLIRVQE